MIFISKLWFPCSIVHWIFIPRSWLQARGSSRLLQAFLKSDRAGVVPAARSRSGSAPEPGALWKSGEHRSAEVMRTPRGAQAPFPLTCPVSVCHGVRVSRRPVAMAVSTQPGACARDGMGLAVPALQYRRAR